MKKSRIAGCWILAAFCYFGQGNGVYARQGPDNPGPEPGPGKATVSGTVYAGWNGDVTLRTALSKKTPGHVIVYVKQDDKGRELAGLHGKRVKATGTVEVKQIDGKTVRIMTLEKFEEVPKKGGPESTNGML